jgi:hypothetical protein
MRNNISTLKNDPDFIRTLIQGNNIIWSLMYYDELVLKQNYHLTFLANADLPFYNAAQAVNKIDSESLQEIEAYYRGHNINPAFYLDPASLHWLKPYLIEHRYSELLSELENWWGILLEEDVMKIRYQDYLKISKSQIRVKIINPQNLDDLNQFLTINQVTNELPDHIIEKLNINMRERIYPKATNTLLIVYVNDVPASIHTLGLYNNMGFLAEGGTLPEFQKLGLYTFTTFFFLKYAYERGAKVVALTCTQDSVTNFTSKRVGLELLFQRQFMSKKE